MITIKFVVKTIGSRMARTGEKVTLLNGKTYDLTESDIVIADAEGPIGLAGIMGGNDSEVDENTKNIVLEVATFDMYTIRKSSMRHGIFTDAVARFNKGQSPLQNARIMQRLMDMMQMYANAEQATNVFDSISKNIDQSSLYGTKEIETSFITSRLGIDLSSEKIGNILRCANFAVYAEDENKKDCLSVTAPFWRTDIELPEDIVEEVGRLYGFDKLPRELPRRSSKPVAHNPSVMTKQKVRQSLSRAGANEVLTYSFVHENVIKKAEQDVSQAFQISNALSPDLQYYRLSVLPSLLDKVHANIKAGFDEFALFEIGKGHNKTFHEGDDDGLPGELEFVDIVYTSSESKDGAPYYRIKQFVDQLARDFNCRLVHKPISESLEYPVTAPFDQARSALVETTDGIFIGMIGELKSSVIKNFKLPLYSAAATLDLDGLQKINELNQSNYVPLSRYPSVERDICFQVANDESYGQIIALVEESLKEFDLQTEIQPVDIYQAEAAETKNITIRIILTSHDHTLTGEEAAHVIDTVASHVTNKLAASVI